MALCLIDFRSWLGLGQGRARSIFGMAPNGGVPKTHERLIIPVSGLGFPQIYRVRNGAMMAINDERDEKKDFVDGIKVRRASDKLLKLIEKTNPLMQKLPNSPCRLRETNFYSAMLVLLR